MNKKLISIVVPVFNEEECLEELYRRTSAVMKEIKNYDYEIVFFDDGSTDSSRDIIESFCSRDTHCKAVFFSKNFGYSIAVFYGMQQAKGDCAVIVHADLQNPPELIPEFIKEWEAGHDVVFGVKNKSKENKLMYAVRTLFYLLMNLVFGMHLIPHATDFEFVDKSIINTLHGGTYHEPFLRAMLLERAKKPKNIYYTQDRRIAGKTHFTFKKYYDITVSWIVFSSKVLPRRFLLLGLIMFFAGILELCIGFLPKLGALNYLAISTPLIIRIIFLVFSTLICFIGIMSEFIIKISERSDRSFIVSEEKRINY